MKKRFLALVMSFMMVFSAVPLSGIADSIFVVASAADLAELQKVFDSVPPKSEWDKYFEEDINTLSAYYDLAEYYLASSDESILQSKVDTCTKNLKNAVEKLRLHTQKISFSNTALTLSVGSKYTLGVTLEPSNSADEIKWQSSDDSVVSVNQKGEITVNKYSPQSVTVIASSNNHTASCRITITNPVEGVVLSETSVEVFENRKHTLTASVVGMDSDFDTTDNVTYRWTSSNESVATVNNSGEITGVSLGSCRVTVTVTAGERLYSTSCNVTVGKFQYITALEPVTVITSGGLNVTSGESRNFSIKISPANASDKNIKWTSSNTDVVTVSEGKINGENSSVEIKGISEGVAKITYTAQDGSGREGSFTVTVRPRITSLELSDYVKVLNINAKNVKLTAKILPENAGNQVLDWSSNNTSVCAVDYDGVLYPNGAGSCIVTAKTTDGSNLTVQCKVIVSSNAKSVKINKSSLELLNGKSDTLKATVTTETGETYSDVVWSSSDDSVVTVSPSGAVKAVYPGQAVITATAADGSGKKATCAVTVIQPVEGVELPSSAVVSIGGSVQLKATFVPQFASNKALIWSSADPSIVKVDSTGTISGVKLGTAVVSCKTVEGDFTASCTVTVVIGVNSVSLNKNILGLNSGESFELVATVSPSEATNKKIRWESSDSSVASVDSAGIVTAKNGGICVITVTTEDGEYTDSCTVSVNQEVIGVEITNAPSKMYVTQTFALNGRVLPETASNQRIIWHTTDSSILRVDEKGIVTAVKAGTASIRAQSDNGKHYASCTITVTNMTAVTGLTLDTTSISLEKGESYLVIPTVTPQNASDSSVTWNSSDLSVATVDESGNIKAMGAGDAVITCTTRQGNFRATCRVKVVQPVNGIIISASETRLAVGKTKTLKYTLSPTNATNKSVMWSTSDDSVVTVSQTGQIKALSSGIAEISVISDDGGYAASCIVTAYVAVTGVEINTTSLVVPKGSSRTVSATVKPSNAENKDLIWSSDKESVAIVNGGKITGKAKGTATITVETKDGNYRDTCTVEVVQLVTTLTLDSTSISLNKGKTKTITPTVGPTTASDRTVKWSSSDKNIATVSSSGVVKAVSAGTVIITCTSRDKNKSATCKVTVTEPATGIRISKTAAYCDVGKTYTLTAAVKPANATNKYVTWQSSNTKIAKVSSKGIVTGIKSGTAIITAKSVDGNYTATCKIVVINPVKDVTLNKTSATINVGKTITLTPKISPSNASITTCTWSSSDNDVATVDSKGRVTGKNPGYATIRVKTKDNGKTDECKILVIQPVSSVKLNKTALTLEVGEEFNFKYSVSPSNASNKAVKWKTSDKNVAAISSTGKLVAKGQGTATITCYSAADSSKKRVCTVKVVKSVTGLRLSRSEAILYFGKKLTLKAAVSPSDATDKTVLWSTSNKSVATVSSKGVVTPVGVGTVTITAKTKDGGLKKTCTVKVERAASSLALSKTALTLDNGKRFNLKATVSPSNTTNKTIEWTSSNEKVAVVSASGKVIARGRGTAVITAETSNGIKKTCKVTVNQPVTGVVLSAESLTVYMGETAKLNGSVSPANANSTSLSVKVKDTSVLTYSKGVIKPLKLGKTTITFTSANGLTAVCTVTVKRHVSSLKLNSASLVIPKGKTAELKATISPADASDKKVYFTSSDKTIATVDANGVITAIKPGEVVITAKSRENGKTAICSVIVSEPVTGLILDKGEGTLFVGESLQLNASVEPSDAYDKTILWSVSDKKVASVKDGKVTALSAGTVTVTAKSKDGGFTAKCVITVNQKANSIELSESSITINKGTEFLLTATLKPENSYNKNVTWKSSDENIIKVENGKVTALAVGNAEVSVISEDGGFTAVCKVRVNEPVNSVEISKKELTLHTGESFELTANVLPSNADVKDVVWESSDEKIAKVEGGKVSALSKGTSTITVKTVDGGFISTCLLTVRQNVTEITTDSETYTLHEGTNLTISAAAKPLNAESLSLTFESSNEAVASVGADGVITGKKLGEAKITITSVYTPSVKKEVKVIVTKPVSEIKLDVESKTVRIEESFAVNAVVLPESAANKSIRWESSNEKVAVVKDGVVTGKGIGTAEISAVSLDSGVKAVCKVTVYQHVTAIKTEQTSYNIEKGKTLQIKAAVYPENAASKDLLWSSSNEEIATVDEKGVVTAKKEGAVNITIQSVLTPEVILTVPVKVVILPSQITLSKESANLSVGETLKLTAAFSPADATERGLKWTTGDAKVATVKDGVITAAGKGTAIITVTSADGKVSAVCVVTVK